METGSNIVTIDDVNRNPRNIIANYVTLTVENIKNNAMNYLGKQTRQA